MHSSRHIKYPQTGLQFYKNRALCALAVVSYGYLTLRGWAMSQEDPLRDILDMLSAEQVLALRTALARPPATGRARRFSEEQLKAIRAEAGSYREAQRKAAEAIGVLWNARLDLAIQAGHIDDIEDALKRPIGDVAFYDNCNCVRSVDDTASRF
jgi:hypothetical protein